MSGVITTTQRSAECRFVAPVTRWLSVMPNVMFTKAAGGANPSERQLLGSTATYTLRLLGRSPT